MRPSEVLPLHRETIRQLVLDAGMTNPRVFGSVVRGEDNEESDLDLLVDPSPKTDLLDLARLQRLIQEGTGARVGLLTPGIFHRSSGSARSPRLCRYDVDVRSKSKVFAY